MLHHYTTEAVNAHTLKKNSNNTQNQGSEIQKKLMGLYVKDIKSFVLILKLFVLNHY